MNELCKPGGRSKNLIKPSNDLKSGKSAPFTGIEPLEPRLLLSASGFDEIDLTDLMYEHHQGHCCDGGFSAPDDDYGDDATEAELVLLDETIFGKIDVIADQDWFMFNGEAGITYTFTSDLFSLPDSQLIIYDTDGTSVVAFDDDSGQGLAAKVIWTAPVDGDYYLAIRGFDINTGTYSIELRDNAVPTGEIRGSKWHDLNENGVRDIDEPGLQGWVIFIDSNNNRKREPNEKYAITDANGDYAITGLRPGTYTIAERIKPGWAQLFPNEDGMELPIGSSIAGIGVDGSLVHTSVVDALGPEAGGLLPIQSGLDPIDFVLTDKWPQPGGSGATLTITYSYSNLLDGNLGGSLTEQELRQGIEEALAIWATYSPFKFVEVQDSGPAPSDFGYPASDHPIIRFGHHLIDGPSSVLAHAFTPSTNGISGDVHFDTGDIWTIGPSGIGYDFLEVAVHEIGHALGLLHEPMPPAGVDAIMNPFYGNRYSGFGSAFLLPDDIAGIQALYGELISLAGAWTVTLETRGDIIEDIDFGNFLNDDFGDGVEESTPVNVNDTQAGIIESFGDLDWFSYELRRGVHYSFGSYLNGIDDTVITLYDQNGVEILSTDDDSGPGLGSFMQWIAPEDGTYYVEVKGFSNSIGAYQLQVVGLAGDLNHDGLVGIEDLTIALSNWNKSVEAGNLLMGDPTFDGFVGIEDLNMILSNWNARTPPPPTPDEPSTSLVSVTAPSVTAESVQADAEPVELPAVVAVDENTNQTRQWQQAQPQRQVATAQVPAGQPIAQNTQAALAAWYRGADRSTAINPLADNPLHALAEPDESDSPLGLWEDSVTG